jgi:hypothetical protein
MDIYGKFAVFIVVSISLAIATLAIFLWVSGVQRPLEFFSRVRLPLDSSAVIAAIVVAAILVFGAIFYLRERVLKTG